MSKNDQGSSLAMQFQTQIHYKHTKEIVSNVMKTCMLIPLRVSGQSQIVLKLVMLVTNVLKTLEQTVHQQVSKNFVIRNNHQHSPYYCRHFHNHMSTLNTWLYTQLHLEFSMEFICPAKGLPQYLTSSDQHRYDKFQRVTLGFSKIGREIRNFPKYILTI